MYTIILKKGKIELEFSTDDKETVRKHLWLIINQASNINQNSAGKNIEPAAIEPELDASIPVIEEESIPAETNQTDDVSVQNNEQNLVENNEETPVSVEVKPVVFEHIQENEKQAVISKMDDIIPQSIDIAPVKPVTINSLQNPEPEISQEPDFDKILNKEIENSGNETPILKDQRFIEYVEGKSALDKIDFLVITAQYLAQYENMNTFNLKHINAKLMQNFTLIVDHSVLQSAIAREFITRIRDGGDDTASEYMLTEKGLRSY